MFPATDINGPNPPIISVALFAPSCAVAQAAKGLPGNPVVPALKAKVDEFSPVLPVVVNLRNNSLKDRHWSQIHTLIGRCI
eukprot:17248-Eustigmatos_ZCMA.PRE.1